MRPLLPLVLLALCASPAAAKLPRIPLPLPSPGKGEAVDPNAAFPGGVLELLPANGLLADGGTAARLQILALRQDGSPLQGLAGLVPATGAGKATPLVDAGGGLYTFEFVPSRSDDPTTAQILLKGKLPDKSTVYKSWDVPVAAAPKESLTGLASPSPFALGQEKSGSVSFLLKSSDPMASGLADVVVRTSAGTVGAVTNLGSGNFTGLYTPPLDATQPNVALVTAVDRREPTRAYTALALPMHGRMDLALAPGKGTRVLVRAGGRDFGPIAADSKGRAKLQIVVPPGVTEATQVVMAADGTTAETPLPLKVSEKRRVAWFPLGGAIPADARLKVPVRVFVVTADGRPDDNASLELSATSGTIGPARLEGGGVYVAEWAPGDGNLIAKATLTAQLAGGSTVQRDAMPVDVVGLRPPGVTLEPTVAPAGPNQLFKVVARVNGPAGVPLTGRSIRVEANGAKSAGVPKDLGDGSYEIPLMTTGNGPIEVFVRAATASAGNPLDRLVLVVGAERTTPDGLSSIPVAVHALDAWGHPVPNLAVDLSLDAGDGAFPTSATTDIGGVAQVYYTAGRAPGLVRLSARYGGYAAWNALVQAPEEVTLPTWSPGGMPERIGELEALEAASARLVVTRP